MKFSDIIQLFQPQQVTCLRCGGAYFDTLEIGLCQLCAAHVTRVREGDLRRSMRTGAGQLDMAAALYHYGDGVRERVYALKFSGLRQLGIAMGDELGRRALELDVGDEPPLVVPVPLHSRREAERGYNQAELLARGVCAATGWRMETELIERRRHTRRNSQLAHAERLNNISGAFVLTGDPRGERLLLIDDVLTTGATTGECARLLREAGAAWVGVLTYASAASAEKDADKFDGDYNAPDERENDAAPAAQPKAAHGRRAAKRRRKRRGRRGSRVTPS